MKGYRVYDKEANKYVTDEKQWVVLPNGELKYLFDGKLFWFPDCIKEDETGSTDKNGNKIFEGDIIEVHTIDGGHLRQSLVEYGEFIDMNSDFDDDYFLGWYIRFKGGCISLLQENKSILEMCEVVGNKWDNPELLEEKE